MRSVCLGLCSVLRLDVEGTHPAQLPEDRQPRLPHVADHPIYPPPHVNSPRLGVVFDHPQSSLGLAKEKAPRR